MAVLREKYTGTRERKRQNEGENSLIYYSRGLVNRGVIIHDVSDEGQPLDGDSLTKNMPATVDQDMDSKQRECMRPVSNPCWL